jgi:tRNA threonylcarbamoyladenosine biosynthesis protein TsaB
MLLAIDTSTPQIGIAILDGNKVIAESTWISKVMHTVELAPSVMELLGRTGIEIGQIQAIGVAIGPGSFTSLRVGLSFVKGLAFSRNIPIAAINSLDIMAAGVLLNNDQPLVCSLPAGRGRHAVGWYKKSTKQIWVSDNEPKIFTIEDLSNMIIVETIFCCDLAEDERGMVKKNPVITLLDPPLCVRRAANLAWLASKKIKKGLADDPFTLSPNYLHIANPIPAIS